MNEPPLALTLFLACILSAAACGADSAPTLSIPGRTNTPPASGTARLTLQQLRALAGTNGFKPYAGNPVLAPGGKGAWDAGALGSMTVVKVKDVYHLYYEAWGVQSKKAWSQEEYNSLQIGHATSTDGVHWMKDPANPVVPKGREENAWDRDGTWDPFVIRGSRDRALERRGTCRAGERGVIEEVAARL